MARIPQLKASLLLYGGPSMNPLLRQRDLLELEPCTAVQAAPGDVIAYKQPGGEVIIVHRVVAVRAGGLITRGDNNDRLDSDPVRDGLIVGRVTAVCRGARRIAVAGGRRGLLIARLLRVRRALRGRLARLIR